MNRWLLLAVAASVGLAACSKDEGAAAPGAAADKPAAAASGANPAAAPSPVATPAATPNAGKIVALEQGGGYTYAQIETGDGRKVWIAGGAIDVKPGDTIQWGDSAVMKNFNAKSLNRTFDEILFVNAWGPAGAAATGVAPHGVPPSQRAARAPALAPTAAQSVGEVKSVENAGGYSYLEVDQNGKTVWVAAPEATVKAGDNVSWDDGMVMKNFNAKSLSRTFDEIVFAGAVRVAR